MQEDATHTVSLISYVLHLIVAVRAIIAWAAISVWFLYRIVLGLVRLNKQQPMEG
jgi:uncharacterized membrane protein